MKLSYLAFERLALLLVTVVSVVAVYISYTTGYIVAYNDATAHLNTARRIVDNLTPGIVQIGSVWLPSLHLFELPFVMNFFLWKTGLAGAIVSSVSFIAGSFFLYKTLYYISQKKGASFFAVLIFITNLNLLYLQTTAMFEPLLIALAFGATYFFTRWVKEQQLQHLVFAALFIMLATLTRYDGWALFLAGCGFVFLITLVKKRKLAEGPLLTFLFLAGFGIVMWLLYNKLIFSDAFYFARSEFSAKAQQDILEARGQLPTKGNLFTSFTTYSLAMIVNNGVLPVGLFLVGLVWYIKDAIGKLYYLAPLLLLVPYGFNIVSLYLGQSVIWMPMLPPYFDTYFNARYGLLMLPAISFFAGYLAIKHWLFAVVLGIGIVVQVFLFTNPKIVPIMGQEIGMITLQDTVSSVNKQTVAASDFLNTHHDGGLILVSSASADAFIFRAGLPLKYFITEGTGNYWKESLVNPAKHASWLVFFKDQSDRVGVALKKSPNWPKQYEKVYEDQTYQIWHRKGSVKP